MTRKAAILIGIVILATAAGQLLLRLAAPKWISGRGIAAFLGSFFRSSGPLAAFCVLGAPFLYWKALETVSLSTAYITSSLTGILVLMGSKFLLKERPSKRALWGALCCIGGIAFWAF